jgi:flavin reductase (DIM6/NTAB) family NADH-FMN oxidoreductase RutF
LRIVSACFAPRPTTLVVTLSPAGEVNVAPFSSIVPLAVEPLLVGLAIARRSDGRAKATLRHIEDGGEFVINAATLPWLRRLRRAPLPLAASVQVRPPRLAGAPFQAECRLSEIVRFRGTATVLVVGEVLRLHLAGAGDVPAPAALLAHVGNEGRRHLFARLGRGVRVAVPPTAAARSRS